MNGASLTIVQNASGGTSFAGSSVAGGTSGWGPGGGAGSGYGADLFLGADVTVDVAAGQTLSLNNVGGGGNTADPNVIAGDPNAQGGLAVTGGGILALTGNANFISGALVAHQGTFFLSNGTVANGTSQVVVGQNAGDDGTFAFGSGATLVIGGFGGGTDAPIILGQDADAFGTFLIGGGNGTSGAFLGARTITSGNGTGRVVFDQNFAAEGGGDTVYPFYTTITGQVGVHQTGPGTTLLQPLYGNNTYTGATVVSEGTLQVGSAGALPEGGALTLEPGGTLDLDGFAVSAGTVLLVGGTITSSTPGASLSATSFTARGGTLDVPLTGDVLLSQESGTTFLQAANSYTEGTLLTGGNLVAVASGALGTGPVRVQSGATLTLDAGTMIADSAQLILAGGVLALEDGTAGETVGAAFVLDDSFLDFGTSGATLTFASLDISAELAIWNWSGGSDAIFVSNAAPSGDLGLVSFFSDNGTTFLGNAAMDGTQMIVAIPEPSTALQLLAAAALLGTLRRRK